MTIAGIDPDENSCSDPLPLLETEWRGRRIKTLRDDSIPFLSKEPSSPPKLSAHLPPPGTFQIPGTPLARGCIGGINGIGNSFADAQAHASYLSHLSKNYQIDWVYNCSHTLFIDLFESILLNYITFSSPAKNLMKSWMKFHKEHKNDPHAKYLQICHSQGAFHVKNALFSIPQEIRSRIIVVAIAPSTIVPKHLCFDSFNYASFSDPIPYTEAAFHYDADASYEDRMAESNRAALKELILLKPHPDAPKFDHSFNSPTFRDVIEKHIEEYVEMFNFSK